MKKYILLPMMALCLAGNAQDFDNDPTVQLQKNDAKFTVGARMMGDVAYYHSDFTPLKSGASLTDARIRTSFSYRDWYFYADFGFGGGKFSQKNIFAQWNKENWANGWNVVKAGYYNDPGSMARNTSLGSYHFISRPGSTMALGVGRELGITYKFYNNMWFANQGISTDHAYNDQLAGFDGVAVSGRWLVRPLNTEDQTFHVGVNARFGHRGGGVVEKNVLKKTLTIGQTMETYVDGTEDLITAEMPWVNNVINVGAELLYRNPKFFARGEFLYKHVTKKRDSYSLFEDAQDNIDCWGTYEAWLAANPLRNNNFYGGYVELGYMIFGNPYTYSNSDGVLGGLSGKSLEIVARYNYTGLNDIVDGEYYSVGRDQYYPAGYMQDYPYASSSVGGGNVNAVTVGLNFSFNKYIQVMADYTYTHLDRDKLPYDRNFHAVQGRVQFTF